MLDAWGGAPAYESEIEKCPIACVEGQAGTSNATNTGGVASAGRCKARALQRARRQIGAHDAGRKAVGNLSNACSVACAWAAAPRRGAAQKEVGGEKHCALPGKGAHALSHTHSCLRFCAFQASFPGVSPQGHTHCAAAGPVHSKPQRGVAAWPRCSLLSTHALRNEQQRLLRAPLTQALRRLHSCRRGGPTRDGRQGQKEPPPDEAERQQGTRRIRRGASPCTAPL